MLRCWDKLGEYDPAKGSFKGWVKTVTVNYMRNEADLLANRVTDSLEHMPEPAPLPDDTTSVSLARYNDREKQLLYWTATDQDFATTAKRFNLTPQELRRRLHRIKTKYNAAA